MVDPTHARLSIVRQCRLVSVARSSFYDEGTGESPLNLRLMRVIDEQFLESAVLWFAADDTLAPPSGRHGLAQTGAPPDATAGGCTRSSNGPGRLSRTRRTGSIPTCDAICRSRGRTTCGARMLPISHCSEAFCTSSP